MYKILIKSKSSKESYMPYQIIDEETGEKKIFETDNLDDLTLLFQVLISEYPLSEIKAIQELDTEILISIQD